MIQPILKRALAYRPQRLVGVALADTSRASRLLDSTGVLSARSALPTLSCQPGAGVRFPGLSVGALDRTANVGTRALPIRFQEVPRLRRPGKKASPEELKQYKAAVKQKNLSQSFVQMGKQLREELDLAGGRHKILVLTADGSFCNRTCFGDVADRSVLLARARKDAKLCFRASLPTRRFFALENFTPEQVRKDQSQLWKTTRVFYGGKRRKVRYKELGDVYWQRGAARRPLRLFVLAPTPYRKRKSGRLYYRDPAYLLTTDLRSSVTQLLQIYFDRWQIEVNHREKKDTLGVGQAQLLNVTSSQITRLAVASYSALLLASLQAFGAERGNAYAELPKWRRKLAALPAWTSLPSCARK